MSTTAVAVLGIYFIGLVLAFVSRPIFALFSYLWIFYNDPQTRWWGGEVPDLRYSLLAAAVAFIACMLKTKPAPTWSSSGGIVMLMLFAAWSWIQTPWAIDAGVHVPGAILFTKYVLLSYVICRLIQDEKEIEWFMWAHVIGCFLFGLAAFNTEVRGRLQTVGGPGVDDSNLLAAHLVTGLVMAGFMFVGLRGYRRWIMLAMIPFIMNAIVLTQSRGGFLALSVAGLAAIYLTPKVHRRFVMVSGVLAVVLILMLGDEGFWNRISTIFAGDEVAEQETRLHIIGPQFQMFLDHPLGVGHRGNELLSREYLPPELLSSYSGTRSAHNTYIAMLVDHGIVGGLLLTFLYGWGALSLMRLKGMDKQGLPPRLALYRAAIGSGLASLFVSGLFLNLLKTEVQIWLVALLVSVLAAAQRPLPAETTAVPAPGRTLARRARLRSSPALTGSARDEKPERA